MRAAIDIVIYEILYDSRELYTKLKQKWNHPNLKTALMKLNDWVVKLDKKKLLKLIVHLIYI